MPGQVASQREGPGRRRRRRLVALDERGVTFRYKDYRLSGPARYCTMTLAPDEFIRRFLLHVLPKGFHRIRRHANSFNNL